MSKSPSVVQNVVKRKKAALEKTLCNKKLYYFVGMLLAGFALRNIPGISFAADIEGSWSSTLRAIALSVILVKAGLELDAGVC